MKKSRVMYVVFVAPRVICQVRAGNQIRNLPAEEMGLRGLKTVFHLTNIDAMWVLLAGEGRKSKTEPPTLDTGLRGLKTVIPSYIAVMWVLFAR